MKLSSSMRKYFVVVLNLLTKCWQSHCESWGCCASSQGSPGLACTWGCLIDFDFSIEHWIRPKNYLIQDLIIQFSYGTPLCTRKGSPGGQSVTRRRKPSTASNRSLSPSQHPSWTHCLRTRWPPDSHTWLRQRMSSCLTNLWPSLEKYFAPMQSLHGSTYLSPCFKGHWPKLLNPCIYGHLGVNYVARGVICI